MIPLIFKVAVVMNLLLNVHFLHEFGRERISKKKPTLAVLRFVVWMS